MCVLFSFISSNQIWGSARGLDVIMLEKESGSGLCYCNQSCLAFAFSGPLEEAMPHNILKSAL